MEWKLHESAFGNGIVEQSSDEPRLTPRCTGVCGTMIITLILRDLIESWKIRKLTWSLDDFVVSCYADDVVLVAASVAAAEVMVADVSAKLKEVGFVSWCREEKWTSHPKMMDTSIGVEGLAVLWEEVLEVVGSKLCSGGNARYAIAHSEQVSGEMETSFELIMAPEETDKISNWSARMVANVIGMKKPPWMERDQL